jgi:hypothetical protein
MRLRDNFPNSKEEAKVFDVEIRDELAVFKIFEAKATIEDTVREVNIFLEKNGYDQIDVSKFVENENHYESPNDIVSLGLHGYTEALVLFINKELGTIVVEISKKVLTRLSEMDYERKGGSSDQRLIFPNKFPSEVKSIGISEEDLLKYTRISEQELRFLFVEEFINNPNNGFFYSVETPTEEKYKFGKNYEDIINNKKTYTKSASIDLSLFKRIEEKYERILNVEFKHENGAHKNIAKDILKLVREKQNGVFIHLLKNTRRDTLCNKGKTGVFDKCLTSFTEFSTDWCKTDKSIQIIIISLKERTLIHRVITQKDNLKDIFSFDDECYGNIKEVKKNEWKIETLKHIEKELGVVEKK